MEATATNPVAMSGCPAIPHADSPPNSASSGLPPRLKTPSRAPVRGQVSECVREETEDLGAHG